MTQIWIAVSVYVLVAIAKMKRHPDASLYTLLQILSVTIFDETPVQQAFLAVVHIPTKGMPHKQLDLFTI